MRNKIGCRDDFDRNLQNISESSGNSNMIRNTMTKHQGSPRELYAAYFHKKIVRIFCASSTEEEISPLTL